MRCTPQPLRNNFAPTPQDLRFMSNYRHPRVPAWSAKLLVAAMLLGGLSWLMEHC